MPHNKITYLLGAGASKNIIPIVKDFSKSLKEFVIYVEATQVSLSNYSGLDLDIKISKTELQNKFVTEALELCNEIQEHTSIDTYARKLYLIQSKQKLRTLKALVSIYLIYVQLTKGFDQRYDSFLATILERDNDKIILPKNLQILSWNYDFQLEMAATFFLGKYYSTEAQEFLNVYPHGLNTKPDELSVIRLNGTSSGFFYQNDLRFLNLKLEKIDASASLNLTPFIEELLSYYYWFTLIDEANSVIEEGSVASIKYSWEMDDYTEKLRNFAVDQIKDTHSLVIIGYSFPTFNRKTDQFLLNAMPNLKNIYIQAKSDSIEGIHYRFNALIGEDRLSKMNQAQLIEVKEDGEEFFIPFEFSKL